MTDERARAAIIGAGTMGAGIAQVALEAGWSVVLHDPVAGATDRARKRIGEGLARRAAKAETGADARADWISARLGRLATAETPARAASEAHLVIEAAIEDLETKRALFAELDRASAPTTALATNTSALSVTAIAEAARIAPERIVGMHFFNPAPVLALVEVVAGRGSASWAVERAAAIAEDWGKTPIRSTDSPGFIVNRVNRPFTLEPLRLLRAGHGTVEGIDAAMVDAGFPMGPFALMDLIGVDVNLAAARGLFEGFDRVVRFRPSPIQEELVAAGTLGRKTGQGFYRYADGKRLGPAPRFERPERTAPNAPELLDAAAISERVILAIVNEAYRALGDKVATADDIDRALKLGAGHPFGPFEWAERAGLHEVALTLDQLSDEDPDTFRPTLALLRRVRG
ncbi:MAG TPA: 3-hydroxyacyl-CoA dehydrogenase NAD-binding domain-containing protein [Candidatus Limnocylindrales bacterium]|nr:3-hydroxyacyl-CoA dehydrogenase NAD-binding domain-containing protein [Candidatus Limnocylindrales bacterium]